MPLDGTGRHVRELASHTRRFPLTMGSTAVCCTVRTALSGFMTNPDLSCELLRSLDLKPYQADSSRGFYNKRWLETVSMNILSS